MPIGFAQIPVNFKQPLYWVELDPSQAGTQTLKQPALLVGQMLATGAGVADIPVPVGSTAEARALFGRGSQLARMFELFYLNNPAHEVWAGPVLEPGAGVAATGSITVTGPATAAGTIALYIAGQMFQVAVGATDTANTIAAAINTALNAALDLPVTSTVATNVVTMTCRWKGATGNDIDARHSYRGTYGGEALPAGVALAYSNAGKLSGGTSQPTFTSLIANLGDQPFEYVALPFTDSTTLGAWETEYGFSSSGRWGFMRQQFGHLVSAYRDTYANLVIWGNTRNSGITIAWGIEVDTPTPVWEWIAALDAIAAGALTNDPARPLQTLSLEGILPARRNQRFTVQQRNSLASNGIATQWAGDDDVIAIKRETTTYQKNKYGQPDNAYELMTTLATLARVIRRQRQAITNKYPRHKLANDGTNFGPGQPIVTPKIIRAELVNEYALDMFDGLVENLAEFKKHLIVERDSNDPDRVNVLYPPDIINGLRIFAVLAQFRLQYPQTLPT